MAHGASIDLLFISNSHLDMRSLVSVVFFMVFTPFSDEVKSIYSMAASFTAEENPSTFEMPNITYVEPTYVEPLTFHK